MQENEIKDFFTLRVIPYGIDNRSYIQTVWLPLFILEPPVQGKLGDMFVSVIGFICFDVKAAVKILCNR